MLHTPDGKGPWRHSILSGVRRAGRRRRRLTLAAAVAALARRLRVLLAGRTAG